MVGPGLSQGASPDHLSRALCRPVGSAPAAAVLPDPQRAGKLVHGELGPGPVQGRTLGGTDNWPKELSQGNC